jgi:hypothetical protein
MSTRRQLRDFVRLNPDYAPAARRDGLGQFNPRPGVVVDELGTEAALGLVDENHGSAQERTTAITKRATLAQQRGEVRETLLEWRFAALNPEFDVAPSRTNPNQHDLAHRHERLLALGWRVALAKARENNGKPEVAAALVRERAEYAARLARGHRPIERNATARARAGAER